MTQVYAYNFNYKQNKRRKKKTEMKNDESHILQLHK